jgi:chalcone synthase
MKDVPRLISKNIEKILTEACKYVGSSDWNDMFWAVHPRDSTILDQVEAKLKLMHNKMQGNHDILLEYGNMSSSSVLYVLDQIW